MSLTYYLSDDGINYIPVTEATPLPVTAGGGGGGTPDPAIGSPDDPAWNGSDPSASLISIMKAIYATQMEINMEVSEIDQDMTAVTSLLQDIKTNTTPAG